MRFVHIPSSPRAFRNGSLLLPLKEQEKTKNGRDKPGHDDDCNERGYQSFARST